MYNAYNTVTLWFSAYFKHFILLETHWHQPTNQQTDIATYKAAITAKNIINNTIHCAEHTTIISCYKMTKHPTDRYLQEL